MKGTNLKDCRIFSKPEEVWKGCNLENKRERGQRNGRAEVQRGKKELDTIGILNLILSILGNPLKIGSMWADPCFKTTALLLCIKWNGVEQDLWKRDCLVS